MCIIIRRLIMFKIFRYENDIEASEDALENETGFNEDEQEQQDHNFEGTIRTVAGACLVYKRKETGNTFEELWIYSIDSRNIKIENDIRNSILAGTDIDPQTQRSPEGDQRASTESVGNVQFLHITGLPN